MHVFNPNGSCLQNCSIPNNSLSPGAFTIILTKNIILIQRSFYIKSVTIFIPAILDYNKRCVQSFEFCSGWSEVPLADWFEIRLKTNVLLLSKTSNLLKNDSSAQFQEILKNYSSFCEQSVLL